MLVSLLSYHVLACVMDWARRMGGSEICYCSCGSVHERVYFFCLFCGEYFKLVSVLISQKIPVHKYGILCCCKCGVQSNWASALTQHQIIVL